MAYEIKAYDLITEKILKAYLLVISLNFGPVLSSTVC